MTQYIIGVLTYLFGVVSGAAIVIIGYKLGFKASYEIRNHKEESTEDKGLFKSKKDPAEFGLLEDNDKKD